MHISLLGMEQHRKRSLSLSSASSAEQPEAFKSSRNDALPLQTYTCSLPPTCSGHKETTFPSCAALEAHHASHHAHLCDECDKIFPDERFLNLHLAECHDPLVAVRAERGEKTVRISYDLHTVRRLIDGMDSLLVSRLSARESFQLRELDACIW